jgi:hypothetical protein
MLKKQIKAKWLEMCFRIIMKVEINGTLVNNKKRMHTSNWEAKARTNKQTTHNLSLSFLPWLTISTPTLYLGVCQCLSHPAYSLPMISYIPTHKQELELYTKNRQISIFGFNCVAINLQGWLKALHFIFGFYPDLAKSSCT